MALAMSRAPSSYRGEVWGRTGLLLASAIGLTAGMTAILFYSLDAFIPPLQAEFGWSRSDISLAASFLTLAVFVMGSLAGRLCDLVWCGAGGGAEPGELRTGGYPDDVYRSGYRTFLGGLFRYRHSRCWLHIHCVGAAHHHFFVRARGIALGVALTGAGIAGFWVPLLGSALLLGLAAFVCLWLPKTVPARHLPS